MDLWKRENLSKLYFEKNVSEFEEISSDDQKLEHQQFYTPLKFDKRDFQYKMDSNLHISKYGQQIIEMLENNRVVLIEGSTGCGKSTQIPYFMLNFFNTVVVSQPRRIAASNLAHHVAFQSNTLLSDLVGYKVRFDENISERTRLKFVTDGILLTENKNYDLIIIDEVHERKINTDIFFAVMEKFKYSRIILMSATINRDHFINFFKCSHLKIHQDQFPKRIHHSSASESDFCNKAAQLIIDLIKNTRQNLNILVFLPGLQEINICLTKLLKIKNCAKILKLHSSIQLKDQQKVFCSYQKSKIILATNIAETSITIPDLDIVIDCGYVKQNVWQSGIEELKTIRISKQQANQRAGRVGRTKQGIVYRLYTEADFNNFTSETEPEIKNTNLLNLIIQLKKFKVGNISKCKFLDLPPAANLKSCLDRLFLLGALDKNGKLTQIGYEIAKLPLDPELALSLIKSKKLAVLSEMAAICAMLTVSNILRYDDQEKFDEMKQKYSNTQNDFLFLLRIFSDYFKKKKMEIVNEKSMVEVIKIHKQLLKIFNSADSSISSLYEEKIRKINASICAGFFLNTAQLLDGKYSVFFNEESVEIHPSSQCFKKKPKYILFYNIFSTTKQYVKFCMSISSKDLKSASGSFKTR
ncbi:nucleoside-triphosphatase, RNA helicase [Pseudoloma neurophilia]|uniref:Nucleoside-triphosphatase, RNA helicase n=1 Tax=Pseudoloma neurophilia TaxID=146866 RepID=A0A0R0M389_9MICR|nr:nucleoside-triphosphatase, RNA helicase [Pseudoloma neurophilia]